MVMHLFERKMNSDSSLNYGMFLSHFLTKSEGHLQREQPYVGIMIPSFSLYLKVSVKISNSVP